MSDTDSPAGFSVNTALPDMEIKQVGPHSYISYNKHLL